MNTQHVVISGAGFGGLNVACQLGDAPAQIVLIDRQNHHHFQSLPRNLRKSMFSPAPADLLQSDPEPARADQEDEKLGDQNPAGDSNMSSIPNESCASQACKTNSLVQRLAHGDQQAFLALYDCYAAQVHALTLHILSDPMLAEEVTQDTFIKLWSRAPLYVSERGSFVAWLLTIARRTALDRVRLERRRPLLSNSKDPEDLWPSLPDESQDSDEARWKSLYFAVHSLSGNQRLVIELAYYQGLSQREIAAELGWPLGTVKTRLLAAIQALRQEWALGDEV